MPWEKQDRDIQIQHIDCGLHTALTGIHPLHEHQLFYLIVLF